MAFYAWCRKLDKFSFYLHIPKFTVYRIYYYIKSVCMKCVSNTQPASVMGVNLALGCGNRPPRSGRYRDIQWVWSGTWCQKVLREPEEGWDLSRCSHLFYKHTASYTSLIYHSVKQTHRWCNDSYSACPRVVCERPVRCWASYLENTIGQPETDNDRKTLIFNWSIYVWQECTEHK